MGNRNASVYFLKLIVKGVTVCLKTTPEATLGLTNQHIVDENQAPETNQLSASKI